MRSARALFVAAALALLAACGAEPTLPTAPADTPLLNGGYMGSSNRSNSTFVTRNVCDGGT
ncbi:MAG TPA: hypothetical protein VHG28_22305 [Longimicrobiaceae bacterium]|nr:hypothetical protein [Longimicrobiaceae bacterium]